MALILVVSSPICAYAQVISEESSNLTFSEGRIISSENIHIPDTINTFATSNNPAVPYAATITFVFDDAAPGILWPTSERFTMTAGTSTLKIHYGLWTPAENVLEFGFFNLDTGTAYGSTYSGGVIESPVSKSYTLPAGTYWVYVINHGKTNISDGTIRFSIS